MFVSFSRVNIQHFSKCRLLQDCCMWERVMLATGRHIFVLYNSTYIAAEYWQIILRQSTMNMQTTYTLYATRMYIFYMNLKWVGPL